MPQDRRAQPGDLTGNRGNGFSVHPHKANPRVHCPCAGGSAKGVSQEVILIDRTRFCTDKGKAMRDEPRIQSVENTAPEIKAAAGSCMRCFSRRWHRKCVFHVPIPSSATENIITCRFPERYWIASKATGTRGPGRPGRPHQSRAIKEASQHGNEKTLFSEVVIILTCTDFVPPSRQGANRRHGAYRRISNFRFSTRCPYSSPGWLASIPILFKSLVALH